MSPCRVAQGGNPQWQHIAMHTCVQRPKFMLIPFHLDVTLIQSIHLWMQRDFLFYFQSKVLTISFIWSALRQFKGFPGGTSGKESICQCGRQMSKRCGISLWVRKIPCRRAWQPTPVFLPGESLGQRRLAGYSWRGHKESDTTEWLSPAHTTQSLKTQPNNR